MGDIVKERALESKVLAAFSPPHSWPITVGVRGNAGLLFLENYKNCRTQGWKGVGGALSEAHSDFQSGWSMLAP